MARLLNDAASDYLYPSLVPTVPMSVACWFKYDNFGGGHASLFSVCLSSSSVNYHWLVIASSDSKLYVQSKDAGTLRSAASTIATTPNTWQHALGIWAGTTDRRVYLNGGNKGTDGNSSNPAGMNVMALGRLNYVTPGNYLSGELAEVAIWNVALTDAEAAALGKGYSPLLIRPQNLVAYWPLVRGLNDKVGGYNLTASGTTVSPHPRIIRPSGIWTPQLVTAAADLDVYVFDTE